MYPDDEIFTIAEALISLCENEEQKRGMDAMLDLLKELSSFYSCSWEDMDDREWRSYLKSFLPK